MRHALVLFTVLFTACADVPEDESADDFPELTLENCPQGRCTRVRAHEALPIINEKRASLDAHIRDAYFAAPTAEIGTTPEGGNPYQWFAGPAGRGAIYVVRNGPADTTLGVFHIYGSLVEEWAHGNYERGYGYFTDPVTDSRGEVRQVFAVSDRYMPSIANHGLLQSRTMLVALPDGTVLRRTRHEYYSSHSPGQPVLQPQQCTLDAYTYAGAPADLHYITPEVSFDGYEGPPCENCFWEFWCGAPSLPPYDGPTNI